MERARRETAPVPPAAAALARRAGAWQDGRAMGIPEPALVPAGRRIEQDWPALARHLARLGMAFDPAFAPEQFAGGFGNLNYRIVVDGAPAVLRRPPPGPRPPGANDMAREGRILRGLAPLFPLAPRCLHFCGDEAVLGAPFLILEHRAGIVIGGALPEALRGRAGAGEALADTAIDTLAALHRVDPEAAGLGDLGRPEGFLARVARGWARRADLAWDGAAPEAARRIAARLEAWAGEGAGAGAPVLLHNDYKLDNLILDPETLAPAALVDWDLGTRGDPLWDLAVLLSYWSEPGDPRAMRELGQMPTAEPGFPPRAEAARRYAARTGRDISGLRPWRAAAQFRLAVVFRQIYRRHRDSGAGDPKAGGFDALADGLLDFALAVAEGGAD